MNKLWLILVPVLGYAAVRLFSAKKLETETPLEEPEDVQEDPTVPTQTVRAEIRSARRDLDPVTLQGWSRVTFLCEDGVERKMQFSGDNGVYLTKGETGVLEHLNGKFISFEKDSGEIVAPLYHLTPVEEE